MANMKVDRDDSAVKHVLRFFMEQSNELADKIRPRGHTVMSSIEIIENSIGGFKTKTSILLKTVIGGIECGNVIYTDLDLENEGELIEEQIVNHFKENLVVYESNYQNIPKDID